MNVNIDEVFLYSIVFKGQKRNWQNYVKRRNKQSNFWRALIKQVRYFYLTFRSFGIWVKTYLVTLYFTYNQWNFCDHCHIRGEFTHTILTPLEFFIMEASIRKVVEQLNPNLKVAEEKKTLTVKEKTKAQLEFQRCQSFLITLSLSRSFSLSTPVLWHLES